MTDFNQQNSDEGSSAASCPNCGKPVETHAMFNPPRCPVVRFHFPEGATDASEAVVPYSSAAYDDGTRDGGVGSPGPLTSGASGPAITPDEAQAETPTGVAWSHPSRGITGDLGGPLPDLSSAASVYDESRRGFAPDGAIIVRKSQHPTTPYYLQRAINDWKANGYYGVHMLIGEEFATREEAEARAQELSL